MGDNIGKITQVMGPVVDVEFEQGKLPNILTALHITNPTISAATLVRISLGMSSIPPSQHCSAESPVQPSQLIPSSKTPRCRRYQRQRYHFQIRRCRRYCPLRAGIRVRPVHDPKRE